MILYKWGKGSSKEQATIILGAESELDGVDAEFDIIERKFVYFDLKSTTLQDVANKKYDVWTIKLSDGQKMGLTYQFFWMAGKLEVKDSLSPFFNFLLKNSICVLNWDIVSKRKNFRNKQKLFASKRNISYL
jgi:hypothetical protein